MTALPLLAGWACEPLRAVADIERNAISPQAIEPATAYVGLEHISSDGSLVGVDSVERGAIRSNKFRFRKGHILYGKLRPYLRKIACPDFDGVCSTDILPIRPKPCMDGSYLRHYLRQPDMVELATRRSSGANLPRLSPKVLEEFPVSYPIDLDEQRRIAAILDRADAVRRKRERAIAHTEELLRSTFLEMFGDPAVNPRNWERKPLRDLARVTTGNTPPRSRPEFYGGDLEWIKSDNINTPCHVVTQAAETLSDLGRSRARIVGAGATLITCIAGSADCIGNAAMTDREVAFNQQINALEPRDGVDRLFLYVQVVMAKRLIQEASTKAMKGMVSKGRLEAVGLMRPPGDLQSSFGEWFRTWKRLAAHAFTAYADSGELVASLSERAFRGEL